MGNFWDGFIKQAGVMDKIKNVGQSLGNLSTAKQLKITRAKQIEAGADQWRRLQVPVPK